MNYLEYVDADDETSVLICQANIDLVVNKAYRTLVKKVDDVNARAIDYTGKLKISEDEREHIESCISFVLEIIGKQSNSRFGETAEEQHRFFRRKYEQETFFLHLFRSIQWHKQQELKGNTNPKDIVFPETPLDEVPGKVHTALKKEQRLFKIKNSEITEKQLYAAAVLYYANFLISALKQNDAIYLSMLYGMLMNFHAGTSYDLALGQVGSVKRQKIYSKKKEKIYKVFIEEDIYGQVQDNEYINTKKQMARKLFQSCEARGIKCSEQTIRTKWLPDFIGRRKIFEE